MPTHSNSLVSAPLLEGLWAADTFDAAIDQCAHMLEIEIFGSGAPELTAMLDSAEERLSKYLRQHGQKASERALALNAEFKVRDGKLLAAAGLLLDVDLSVGGKLIYRTRLLQLLLLEGRRDTARFFALKWLKARSHTGVYWWFYASLVDTPAQYQALCQISDKPAKNRAAAAILKKMKPRALARGAHKAGDLDKAHDLYIALLEDELLEVNPSDLKKLGRRRKIDMSNLHFLHVPPMPPADENQSPALGDLSQALFEQTKQGNWQAVLNVIEDHGAALEAHSALLVKLKALAERQVLCGWPTQARPNAGVVAASALLAEGLEDFWLDSGSLLGIMRNGKPIAWDSDIDFGIWDDAVPALLTFLDELSEKGYWVSHRRYYGHVYGATLKITGSRTIHIHVFYRSADGKQACSPQTLCYYKPATRPDEAAPFKNYPLTRKVLCKFHNAALSPRHKNPVIRYIKKRILGRGWRLFVRIRTKVKRENWTTMYPFKALYATGSWVIPAHYLNTLDKIQVDGVMVPIPNDVEAYLTFRYAEWRIPQQEWCYWLDDGAHTPKSPQALGFEGMFKGTKV